MSGNCDFCHKGISKGRFPAVKCALCASRFHIKCAEISDAVLEELKNGATSWMCPDCRKGNSSIIDENHVEHIAPNCTLTNNTSLTDLVIILQGMQNQLDEVKNSLNFLCNTFDDMKITINQLTIKSQYFTDKIDKLESKCEGQDDKINTIEAQLDRPVQEANKSNIVFCGIPTDCDITPELIMQLIGLVGVRVVNEDIVSIKKMIHYRETTSLLKNAFIVKLNSDELTNNILSSFRKKKFLSIGELGGNYSMFNPNHRILLLHHFTRLQSRLYSSAKIIKNNYKFQFLWCKNNNIYLRKTADSKVHQIFSFNDIKRLHKILQPSDSMVNSSDTAGFDESSAVIAGSQ